jgi:hypothetical protein
MTPARAPEQGFILLGVVMFMLALTILGLSLFSLSSYESQFFQAGLAREQAMQRSESGLELVKALLTATPNRLENANAAVGQYGITKAMAYQWRSSNANDTTSRGTVNWDSTVVIVVTSRDHGQTRTVQSRFRPGPPRNPYTNLVTCAGTILTTTQSSNATIEFQGQVWQRVTSSADTSWTPRVLWTSGRPFVSGTPPTVLGNTFVNTRLSSASLPTTWDPNRLTMTLRNTGTSPALFRTPASPTSGSNRTEYSQYGFFTDNLTTISVSGTCLLLAPTGICMRDRVTIAPEPGTSGTLVIVAKPNGVAPGSTNRALWFESGFQILDPTNMKVVLVTEGDIALQAIRTNDNRDMMALSIVAGGNLELLGPSNGKLWRMFHGTAMDAVLNDLVARGALPLFSGGTRTTYAYQNASWKETRVP